MPCASFSILVGPGYIIIIIIIIIINNNTSTFLFIVTLI